MKRYLVWLIAIALAACASKASPAVGAEKVSFMTDDGVKIVANYFRPHKMKGKNAPVVILLPMMNHTKESYNNLAGELIGHGYVVLALDLRGHGESVRFPAGERRWSSFDEAEFGNMVDDVRAAVKYLGGKPEANTARIAIIGASIGANVALRYSVENKNVRTVVLLSPGLDYHGVTTEDAIAKYGTRAIFIVASENDSQSVGGAQKLYDLATDAKPRKIKIYRGSAHGTDIFSAQAGLASIIVAWLSNNLVQ
jgi:dienelactone hydrolase